MQKILWDMLRADVFLVDFAGKGDTTFNRPKESISLYQKILAIHNTNKGEFKKSLAWYKQHPIVMKIILDTLQKRQNSTTQEQVKPVLIPETDTFKNIKKNIIQKRNKISITPLNKDSSKK